MMSFITQEQPDLFPNPIHLFSLLSKEKEKETKRKDLVYQPFAEVGVLQNDVNQKVRETVCYAKVLNPGWEGVKSIPKTSQSLPINGSAMRAEV